MTEGLLRAGARRRSRPQVSGREGAAGGVTCVAVDLRDAANRSGRICRTQRLESLCA
jgi:hypothetical protein